MTSTTNRPNVAGNGGPVGALITIAIALCALSVDPPIPEQLALGRVFIHYRTENLQSDSPFVPY